MKSIKVDNARERWLTIEDEIRLIDSSITYATGKGNIKVANYWLQEIVVVALNTGMRMDEILSLEWTAVDLFRKTLTVMKSKNGEKRTIPMSKKVFELVKQSFKKKGGGYVFFSHAGTKIDKSNLRRSFYKALERAGVEDFRFHDLRHTFATRLVQAGIDLYKVSILLGHKDIKMTQRYAHHCSESLREGVDVLDEIGKKSKFSTIQ